MSVREILDSSAGDHTKKAILEMEGQVVDILPALPRGYVYRLQKVHHGSLDSQTVLSVVKEEGLRR